MHELRRLAVMAGLLAQLSAALAGVLPWPLLPVVAVLHAVAVVAAERAGERRARQLNAVATGLALLLAAVTAPRLSADRDALRTALGLLLVLVQVVQALTWRTLREIRLGLAIAAALLVLGASFAPDLLVGLPLLVGWGAVVGGIVLCVDARMREHTDVVVAGGRRSPLVPVTASALALGLGCFLLIPVTQIPTQRNPLAALSSLGGGVGARGAVTYSSTRLDLRTRGSLSDKPVLEVPADSAPLWRSQVFGLYGGLAWSAVSGQLRPVPGPPWTVGTVSGPTRSDRAVRQGSSESATWAPAEPVRIDASRGAVITDGAGTVRSAGLRSYTVTSVPQVTDPALLRKAVRGGRENGLWLQLPTTLPDRVRALATELTAAAPTRFDAVQAVETWLRANATYTLDSPVPGPGEDAVDRFLFVDRVGFCEQFAAAETVLLRAAGIPARLATGLAGGVPTGAGRRMFRENDLHAWVEVSYPGLGWSPSDPTAGVPLAGGSGGGASIRARLNAAVDRVVRTAQSVPGGRGGLAALLIIGAVAIAVLAPRHRPRRRRAVPAATTATPQTGPALAAFLRYDEQLGARRRRPHESLAELAARLDEPPRRALAVVEAECYAATPPADAQHAAELLDRLALSAAGREQ